jgi:hypothetical protein
LTLASIQIGRREQRVARVPLLVRQALGVPLINTARTQRVGEMESL